MILISALLWKSHFDSFSILFSKNFFSLFLKTNVSFFFFLITMLTNQCSDSGLKSTSLQNQLQSQQQKKGQQKGKKQFCLRKLLRECDLVP